jgi:hypothetical protein
MKKTKKWLGLIVIVALTGFSITACGDKDDSDSGIPNDSGIKWRSELTHINGNWHQSEGYTYYSRTGVAFFNYFGSDGEMRLYDSFSPSSLIYDFTLISKDDKPVGQESSFSIKRRDPGASIIYTIKYILADDGNSLNIIDKGEFPYSLDVGKYTKVEY